MSYRLLQIEWEKLDDIKKFQYDNKFENYVIEMLKQGEETDHDDDAADVSPLHDVVKTSLPDVSPLHDVVKTSIPDVSPRHDDAVKASLPGVSPRDDDFNNDHDSEIEELKRFLDSELNLDNTLDNPDDSVINIGNYVIIHSLQNKKDFNGLKGLVLSIDKNIYEVLVYKTNYSEKGKFKFYKNNLNILSQDDSTELQNLTSHYNSSVKEQEFADLKAQTKANADKIQQLNKALEDIKAKLSTSGKKTSNHANYLLDETPFTREQKKGGKKSKHGKTYLNKSRIQNKKNLFKTL